MYFRDFSGWGHVRHALQNVLLLSSKLLHQLRKLLFSEFAFFFKVFFESYFLLRMCFILLPQYLQLLILIIKNALQLFHFFHTLPFSTGRDCGAVLRNVGRVELRLVGLGFYRLLHLFPTEILYEFPHFFHLISCGLLNLIFNNFLNLV